jgi:hypothetical protein
MLEGTAGDHVSFPLVDDEFMQRQNPVREQPRRPWMPHQKRLTPRLGQIPRPGTREHKNGTDAAATRSAYEPEPTICSACLTHLFFSERQNDMLDPLAPEQDLGHLRGELTTEPPRLSMLSNTAIT